MTPQQLPPSHITIFLPNGTPDGIKIVDKSDWPGTAIAGPRSRFDELRKRPEFSKTGVYVLTGQPDPDGLPMVYIGEGDPVTDRLVSHYVKKDFWSAAVFFVNSGKDGRLNKAHVQYLEARLVSLAKEAKRCVLDNANAPQLPALSEVDTAYVEVFLGHMLLLLGVLGVSVFQKAAGLAPSTRLLYINAKTLSAVGYEVDGGFVVRAGSQSPKEPSPSIPDSTQNLRQALISQGVFVEEKGCYRMTQDYTFTSPSSAAGALLARSANGRDEWKDGAGRTLKDIQGETA
jgi:hypothetical protein